MEEIIKKACTLIEALPYISKFQGKTFVIKYGGSIMANQEIKKMITEDVTLLKYVGINPVIVHGGGPEIDETLQLLNIKSNFTNGLRVTDQQTMQIVEMVLAGRINKEIVTQINSQHGQSVGISGKDGGLITARKMVAGGEIDLGYVGEVESVNPKIISNLIKSAYIPVVAPIAADATGETFNINADTVAGEIAASLHAEKLIFLTDVNGIRKDPEQEESIISSLNVIQITDWIEKGKIVGGMLPKVKSCIQAVNAGVRRTHILNGYTPHAILLEIFTNQGIGTMIKKSE